MALCGSFSSAFTRRNCDHDTVFHTEYQRTNRTKENKILRCFPHCCPQHVGRSYCGSSLHLQVDFHTDRSTAFHQSIRDDDLLVFGRFRSRESRGFRVGDRIAAATILSSLQSEDNPTGEWIEAWLIASADSNAWLYEVNHSARWYYNWGSSAAKDKRLKEHVFEAYVLYPASGSAQAPSSDVRGSAESFQVAAVSCSPPFKLLSFRRAPAETRRRGHAHASAEQFCVSGEDSTNEKPVYLNDPEYRDRRPTHRSRGGTSIRAVPLARQRASHHARWNNSSDNHRQQFDVNEGTSHQPSWRLFPPTHRASDWSSSRSLETPHVPLDIATRSPRSACSLPSRSLYPSTHSFPKRQSVARPPAFTLDRTISDQTASSVWYHPHHDSAHPVETRSRSLSLPTAPVVYRAFCSHTQLDDVASVLSAVQALPLADAANVAISLESILQQYTTAGPLNLHTSTHGLDRVLTRLELPRESSARSPRRLSVNLVHAAVHLALWLELDPVFARARSQHHEYAAAVLLQKPALVETHKRFVRWLHAQIDAFLRRRGWSLAMFLVELTNAQQNCQLIAGGTGVAFADFVAQVREQFLREPASDRPKKRARQHVDGGRNRPQLSRHLERPTRLAGVWRSDLRDARVRRLGPVDTIPLDALVWFWKQFGCVAISVLAASSVSRVLEMRSAFASPAHGSAAMRLVLDGRSRWFRTFPCGESTSARRVGTQSFGDYRAVRSTARDSVECAMYSWPAVVDDTTGDDHDVEDHAGYCWRWQLTPMPDAPTPTLRVQLVVERGGFASSSVRPEALAVEPLAHKCGLVDRWEQVLLAEWGMTPCDREAAKDRLVTTCF